MSKYVKSRRKDEFVERTAPVTESEKELMLMVLLRDKNAFESVRDRLEVNSFTEYEQGFRLIWTAVTNLYETLDQELPGLNPLMVELQNLIDDYPEELSDDAIENLDAVVRGAFELEPTVTDRRYATAIAERVLQEKLVEKVRTILETGVDFPRNLPGLLGEYADRSAEVANLQPCDVGSPFPEGWEGDLSEGIKRKSTCVPFLDYFLGGGHAPGEVYLVLGPYGSCKTALAVQGSIRAAIHEQSLQKERQDDKIGLCYLFAYEAKFDEMRLRGLSCAAQVHYPGLLAHGVSKLSTTGDLKEYELKRFSTQLQQGAAVVGERERIKHYTQILNVNWRPIDMTGTAKTGSSASSARGTGLVPEIAAIIKNDLDSNPNAYCAGVWVDYIGAMAERHIESRGLDHGELRHLVKNAPLHLTNKVAQVFQCPVWVFHQYSGSANSRKPGVKMHHTDASEAKNVGENAAFIFNIGPKTSDELCTLELSKGRREKIREQTIIRIDGEFQTVLETKGQYMVDPISKMITRTADYNRISHEKSHLRSGDAERRQLGAV